MRQHKHEIGVARAIFRRRGEAIAAAICERRARDRRERIVGRVESLCGNGPDEGLHRHGERAAGRQVSHRQPAIRRASHEGREQCPDAAGRGNQGG